MKYEEIIIKYSLFLIHDFFICNIWQTRPLRGAVLKTTSSFINLFIRQLSASLPPLSSGKVCAQQTRLVFRSSGIVNMGFQRFRFRKMVMLAHGGMVNNRAFPFGCCVLKFFS